MERGEEDTSSRSLLGRKCALRRHVEWRKKNPNSKQLEIILVPVSVQEKLRKILG